MIRGVEGFLTLKETWEGLVNSDPSASPFVTWDWICSWIDVYGVNREFITLVCRDGHEIVGIVPFTYHKTRLPLMMRKLWMVGFHSSLGSNGLTEEPILALKNQPQTRELALSAIHLELKKMLESSPWDTIAYRRFGRGIAGCSLVELKPKIAVVQQYERGCEYVEFPPTWEAYLKGLSKSMRENIPYYRRKLAKSGAEIVVETIDSEELEIALDAMIGLHKKRTYADEDCFHIDYFADPRQRELLSLALRKMIPAGEAKLVVLKADGKIIAAQTYLRKGSMAIGHYSGFDPEWAKFSPLLVLQSHVVQEMIQSGVTTWNLLRGNAAWQQRWGSTSRDEIIDVTLAKRSVLARGRQKLHAMTQAKVKSMSTVPVVQRLRASAELRKVA